MENITVKYRYIVLLKQIVTVETYKAEAGHTRETTFKLTIFISIEEIVYLHRW